MVRSRSVVIALWGSLLVSPAGAATLTQGTFSGVVRHVSPASITVSDASSHRSMSFLISHTDGYGVLSADGKTTYQMSAIRVGWHVKVDYDRHGSGKRNADHVVVLR
jgi:hypothetical protein